MSSKDAKAARSQARYVAKELLSEQFIIELRAQLKAEILAEVKEALDRIDKRSRDVQSYVLRNNAK